MDSVFVRDEVLEYQRRQHIRFPHHACELPPTHDRVFPQLSPSAPLRQRLKRSIQRGLIAWRRNRDLRLMRPSNYMIEKEQAMQTRSKQWWLIHPMSRFWMYWQLVIVISNLLFLFATPYRAGFIGTKRYITQSNTSFYVSWLDSNNPYAKRYMDKREAMASVLDTFIDINQAIFILHMTFKFFNGFYDIQHNVVVMKQSVIMLRYIKTWFIPDFLTVLAFIGATYQIIYYEKGGPAEDESEGRIQLIVIWLLIPLRILRVHDTYGYIRNWCWLYNTPTLIIISILYCTTYLLYIQWSIFFIASTPFVLNGADVFSPKSLSWVADPASDFLNINRTHPLRDQYVTTVYRVLVADGSYSMPMRLPRMSEEDATIMLINMWVGKYFNIYLFTIILMYTERIEKSKMLMINLYDQLKNYGCQCLFSMRLYKRLKLYYERRFQRAYYNEEYILANLPRNVRSSVRMGICRKVIMASTLFQGMPKSLVNAIAANLIEELYLPHDVVYSSGTQAAYLYFLSIGTVAIYLRTGEEIGHLIDGDYFGEMGLVLRDHEETRMESIVALESTEIYKLPISTFRKLIKPAPRLYNRLYSAALMRAEELQEAKEQLDAWRESVKEIQDRRNIMKEYFRMENSTDDEYFDVNDVLPE